MGIFYYSDYRNIIIYYFIAFSVSISEYANIIFMYLTEVDVINFDLINRSFAISFYRIIFNFFKNICFFNCQNKTLILIQFIIGCIFIGFYSLVLIISRITVKYVANDDDDTLIDLEKHN